MDAQAACNTQGWLDIPFCRPEREMDQPHNYIDPKPGSSFEQIERPLGPFILHAFTSVSVVWPTRVTFALAPTADRKDLFDAKGRPVPIWCANAFQDAETLNCRWLGEAWAGIGLKYSFRSISPTLDEDAFLKSAIRAHETALAMIEEIRQ